MYQMSSKSIRLNEGYQLLITELTRVKPFTLRFDLHSFFWEIHHIASIFCGLHCIKSFITCREIRPLTQNPCPFLKPTFASGCCVWDSLQAQMTVKTWLTGLVDFVLMTVGEYRLMLPRLRRWSICTHWPLIAVTYTWTRFQVLERKQLRLWRKLE